MIRVVCSCYDGSLHGWKEHQDSNFELAFAYKAHKSCTKCLAVSQGKKKYLASGGTDEIIRVYSLDKLQELGELTQHKDTILSLAFVGSRFLISGDKAGELFIWRCRDWECVSSLKGHKPGPIESIAVHPSAKIALTTSQDNSLRMWNLETARPASRNRIEDRRSLGLVKWSPSGDSYLVVGDNRFVMLFSVADTSGKPKVVLKTETRVNALLYLSDKRVVIGLDNGIVNIFDITEGFQLSTSPVDTLECPYRIRSLELYTTSKALTCLAVAMSNCKIQLYDTQSWEEIHQLEAASDTHLTCMVAVETVEEEAESRSSSKRKNAKDHAEKPATKKTKSKHNNTDNEVGVETLQEKQPTKTASKPLKKKRKKKQGAKN